MSPKRHENVLACEGMLRRGAKRGFDSFRHMLFVVRDPSLLSWRG